jgi:enoyl-CoA hydratase
MINKLCDAQSLLTESLTTARAIAANAPVAVRQAKVAITNGLEVDRRTGLVLEIAAYNQTVPTQDRREGIRAAIERRAPNFTGE